MSIRIKPNVFNLMIFAICSIWYAHKWPTIWPNTGRAEYSNKNLTMFIFAGTEFRYSPLRFKHKLIFAMDRSNPEKLTVLITESKLLEVSISAFWTTLKKVNSISWSHNRILNSGSKALEIQPRLGLNKNILHLIHF